ncbi:MAG: hypothetical protein ACREMS_06665 [Gemmatimonadaceae bacterium]
MATVVMTTVRYAAPVFPGAEIKRRLTRELKKIADDNVILRPEWEPVLDSKRVVGTLVMIEDLFPDCRIPPDKVVKKGGYRTIDEAINDMIPRIRRVVAAHSNQTVGT